MISHIYTFKDPNEKCKMMKKIAASSEKHPVFVNAVYNVLFPKKRSNIVVNFFNLLIFRLRKLN